MTGLLLIYGSGLYTVNIGRHESPARYDQKSELKSRMNIPLFWSGCIVVTPTESQNAKNQI